MHHLNTLRRLAREHWGILIILFVAVWPLFLDLGGDYLWSDEGDTAVLANSILKYGVPKAWDGVTFTDQDFGTRVNDQMVMVSHPWLQYYVTAASFSVFGQTPFAARLPFALAGLFSILMTYLLIVRVTGDKRAAIAACVLLISSTQFLLFSRQCRNYALNMLLTTTLLVVFFSLHRRRGMIAFALLSIAAFHCHPSALAVIGALGAMTLVYRPFRIYRRGFWTALPVVVLLTLPWVLWAKSGYKQNTELLTDPWLFPPRLTQFLIECASVTPIIGAVAMFIYVLYSERPQKAKGTTEKRKLPHRAIATAQSGRFSEPQRNLLFLIGGVLAGYALLMALTQSRSEMFNYGLRHVVTVIPLIMALTGILVSKISKSSTTWWVGLLLLFITTKIGGIGPVTFLDKERFTFDGKKNFAALHVPKGWVNKFFRTSLLAFAGELWQDNNGTVSQICRFLREHARPDDILITNYGWEPIYFHTHLAQGLKIMPHYPIYEAAKRYGLPDYTFSVEGADWLVWRWGWEGFNDYHFQQVIESLAAAGAKAEKIAILPETAWENRANVHFHRFPGDQHIYPWVENAPKVVIFHIVWPLKTSQSVTMTAVPGIE